MGEFIGKRVVPRHDGVWDKTKSYEPLTIVLNEENGDSYISRRDVPVGTVLSDEHYWSVCSRFSEQMRLLADDVDADVKAMHKDVEDTKSAMSKELADTKSAMSKELSDTKDTMSKELSDTHDAMSKELVETETRVTDSVDRANAAMQDTENAMNEAVEQMTARLDANVSASTDADADYAAEVADARVDEEGTAHENLGNAIRSISERVKTVLRTEMKAEDKRSFHAQLAEHYGDVLLESCDVSPYGETPNYSIYDTSTFSGWVTEYTATEPMLVTGVSCFVKAREAPISKVRIAVALDERLEAKNIYEGTQDVTIDAEVAAEVTCAFPGTCLEAGQKMYVLCEADAICSHGFSKSALKDTTSWYATDGKMTPMENCVNGTRYSLCFILHGYSMTEARTDRIEKSIRAESVRIDAVEESLAHSFSEQPVMENVQDLIPVINPKPTYSTSSFTGWAGPIGAAQNFNTLIFEIINRDTNPGYLETIRCVISVFDRDGEVLMDETQTGFHIAPGERRKVAFRFTKPIANAEGAALFAGFTCDQWITVVYGSTGINLNAPDYGHVCYTSHNAEPPKLNTQPISEWQNLYDLNHTNQCKPVLYTAYCSNMLLLSEQHLKQVDERNTSRFDEIDASIKEQGQRSDVLEADISELQMLFPTKMLVTELEDLLPIQSERLNYNTSTFTGWGAPIGPVKHFNALRFSVMNRAENTGDITTIRCVVSVFDKSGEILADKTMTDFHIAPGERKGVLFPLDTMIENEGGAQIYAAFACDQHISVYTGSAGVNLNPPEYGNVAYLAVGGEAPYPVTKELSLWSDVYDANLNNKTKCNIRTALVEQTRLLGKNQIVQVEQIVDEKMDGASLSEQQKEQVRELAMEVKEYPPRVVLPDRYIAVAGDTLQLFYRGIVEHPNPYIYNIDCRCDIGKNTSRYFEVTPTTGQVGKHTLKVEVRNHLDEILVSASTVIEVVPIGKEPVAEKNILCIGDSLTSGGYWPAEAYRRLTASDGAPAGDGLGNIHFIGTKKRGEAGYEGYGGWTWGSYLATPSETTSDMWVYASHDKDSSDQHSIWKDAGGNLWQMETIEEKRIKFTRYNGHTADMPAGNGTLIHSANAVHTADILFTATAVADQNPFWDTDADEVNFKTYCERNGFAGIDYVYTLLTWNGLTGYQAETDSTYIAKHVENAKALLRMDFRRKIDFPELLKLSGQAVEMCYAELARIHSLQDESVAEIAQSVETVHKIDVKTVLQNAETKFYDFLVDCCV